MMGSLFNIKSSANADSNVHQQNGEASGQRRRAAVIGGGPSGIQAAGELMKQNFRVTLFERHDCLGGTWAYDKNERLSQESSIQGVKPFLPKEVSAVYKELRTNVPFQSMAIDGFSIPQPEDIRFAHRSEIRDYLYAYKKHLEQEYPGLIIYRLNTTIESVSFDGDWSVVSQLSGQAVCNKFDIVVVATGPFHQPSGADLHDPEFEGIAFHSVYYDDPSVLDDRSVLIVGGKNSARDLFWDSMERAKQVVLACPTPQHQNNMILPGDHRSEVKKRHIAIGRVEHIQKDGTIIHTNWQGQEEVLEGISVDTIIYCSGYKREFPFLSTELQPSFVGADGSEVSNCYMYTAHKAHPKSLFFFHPIKARTPFNTMARDTHAQARLMASLAVEEHFLSPTQLEQLDGTLQGWLDLLHEEWAKEALNSCPCAVQNPFFMNFLNATVDLGIEVSCKVDIGPLVMGFIIHRMKDRAFRKQNTIWHAGMNLRARADGVNWNVFRFLRGKVIGGPDVDGSEFYTVTWSYEDGRHHSTYCEDETQYEDLIRNGKPADWQSCASGLSTLVDDVGFYSNALVGFVCNK